MKHLLVVVNGTTYIHLVNLKNEYGDDLQWMIPYPGDWYLLKNFQPVLIKMYLEAGLKQLAEAMGFRGETLTSLLKCSNFKRTHQFLSLAIYQHMIEVFLITRDTTTIIESDHSY